MHAIWIHVAVAHAEAIAYGAVRVEIVTSPAGVSDDCVCGDEGGEDGEKGSCCEEGAKHDEELKWFLSYTAKLFGRDDVQAMLFRTCLIGNEETEDLKQRRATVSCKNRYSV